LPKPTETTEDGFIAGYPECISDPDCSVGNICIRNYCISKVLPEPTASTIPGDLDGDNIVSNSDVQLFFDSVTNLAEQPDNLCAADLNGNGYLDGADGVIAMRLQNGSLTIEQLKTIRESLSLPALGCN